MEQEDSRCIHKISPVDYILRKTYEAHILTYANISDQLPDFSLMSSSCKFLSSHPNFDKFLSSAVHPTCFAQL
jgi:hypothetical protein